MSVEEKLLSSTCQLKYVFFNNKQYGKWVTMVTPDVVMYCTCRYVERQSVAFNRHGEKWQHVLDLA